MGVIGISQKEKELTIEKVKEYFFYKDGWLYWNKDIYKVIKKGSFAGTITKDGYYQICIDSVTFLGHRIIFFFHKGYFPINVDHKDRNRANCKIENLREATFSQNQKNRNSVKNSSSKYLGVTFKKQTGRWVARIRTGVKQKNIGYFITEEEAALAYNKNAVIYHGEFANLNIITLV